MKTTALITLTGLLLFGCAGHQPHPESEAAIRFDPAYSYTFSTRAALPKITTETPAELETKGLSNIGRLSASQTISVCYYGEECDNATPDDPLARMLATASKHGADSVKIAEQGRKNSTKISKNGKCISKQSYTSQEPYCAKYGNGYCLETKYQSVQRSRCVSWEQISGTATSLVTTIDLWRQDPQLVQEKEFSHALQIGDATRTRVILTQGFDPRQSSIQGLDYLALAAGSGKPEVVSLLLSHGLDLTRAKFDLVALARGNYAEMLDLLLRRGLDKKKIDNKVFEAALQAGSRNFLKIIEAHQISYNQAGPVLHKAVESGDSKTAEYLISKGLRPDDQKQATISKTNLYTNDFPLHEAARKRDKQIIKLLLQNGADPNQKNGSGIPPLVFLYTLDNSPPLDLEILQLFLDHGADINGFTKRKNNTLMMAVDHHDYAAVKFLLEHGADPNLRHEVNVEFVLPCCTALDIARKQKSSDIEQLLLQYNAQAEATR